MNGDLQTLSNEELLELLAKASNETPQEMPDEAPSRLGDIIKRSAFRAVSSGLDFIPPQAAALNIYRAMTGKPTPAGLASTLYDAYTKDAGVPKKGLENIIATTTETALPALAGGGVAAGLRGLGVQGAKAFPVGREIASSLAAGASMGAAENLGEDSLLVPAAGIAGGMATSKISDLLNVAKTRLMNTLLGERLPPMTDAQKGRLEALQRSSIPATVADVTGRRMDQLPLDMAKNSSFGPAAEVNVREFENRQRAALRQRAQELAPTAVKGEALEQPLRDVQTQVLREGQDASERLRAAETDLRVPRDFIEQNVDKFKQQLISSGGGPNTQPLTFGFIRDFDNLTAFASPNITRDAYGIEREIGPKTVDFKAIADWQSSLKAALRDPKNARQERRGLALLNKFSEEAIADAVQREIILGNKDQYQNLKEAQGYFREYAKKYRPRSGSDYGRKFIEDLVNYANPDNIEGVGEVTAQQAVNLILGNKSLGADNGKTADMLKYFQATFGKDSGLMQGLSQEYRRGLLETLRAVDMSGSKVSDAITAQTFRNNLRGQLQSNADVANLLLTQEQKKALIDLGDAVFAITDRDRSKINPSGTFMSMDAADSYINRFAKGASGFFVRNFLQDVLNQKAAKDVLNRIDPNQLERMVRLSNKIAEDIPQTPVNLYAVFSAFNAGQQRPQVE